MTDVRIRNLENWVVEWHRQAAKRYGRSLEGQLRELLTAAVLERKRQMAESMRADLAELQSKHGMFADSTPGIRADREDRG